MFVKNPPGQRGSAPGVKNNVRVWLIIDRERNRKGLITMSDKEVITGYRDNVFMFDAVQQQIQWFNRHDLPVLALAKRAEKLINNVTMFEEIVNRIPDRRTRNAIRCRYALGMSIGDTADYLNINRMTVNRMIERGLNQIDNERS